jgi:dUTP pyrophosphatase
MKLQIKLSEKPSLSPKLPSYATNGSSGLDLCSANIEDIIIKPNNSCLIPTGLSIALPIGFEAQVRPRSGLALKKSITVLNTPGTIDSDYRGEIGIILINHGKEDFIVGNGMKVAQLIVSKYEKVSLDICNELDNTERGEGGFGSTGGIEKVS